MRVIILFPAAVSPGVSGIGVPLVRESRYCFRFDEMELFKNCDYISEQLPSIGYGTKQVKTSNGLVTVPVKEMPTGTKSAFVRSHIASTKETSDLKVLSRNTLFRILDCMALSTRYAFCVCVCMCVCLVGVACIVHALALICGSKQRAALTEEVADSGKLFEEMKLLVSRCYGILDTGKSLAGTKAFIDLVQQWLKASLSEKLVVSSEDENYCLSFLLSDPKVNEFGVECKHSHKSIDTEAQEPWRLVALLENVTASACELLKDDRIIEDLKCEKGLYCEDFHRPDCHF